MHVDLPTSLLSVRGTISKRCSTSDKTCENAVRSYLGADMVPSATWYVAHSKNIPSPHRCDSTATVNGALTDDHHRVNDVNTGTRSFVRTNADASSELRACVTTLRSDGFPHTNCDVIMTKRLIWWKV